MPQIKLSIFPEMFAFIVGPLVTWQMTTRFKNCTGSTVLLGQFALTAKHVARKW